MTLGTPKKAPPQKPEPKPKSDAKPVPKSPAKAPPKPAPKPGLKPAPKPTLAKPGEKPDGEEAPVKVPLQKLEKVPGRDTLCQIEIVKDGHVFIARTETDAGTKEYKNTVFEDLLTEMLITLQEQIADH
ncbi:MAG: hypothetical protein ACYDBQ_00900 [Thermoplasmatota archaeon]